MIKTYVDFAELIGLTLSKVSVSDSRDEIDFVTDDGRAFRLYHDQDCCESVSIDDIVGDLKDLLDSPLLMAEESSSGENPRGVLVPKYQDSFTWTFYRLATRKGYVTIRWYGESNGYYSESVTFAEVQSTQ